MPDLNYDREITGLLVIDPYNDFVSEGGKAWPRIKDGKYIAPIQTRAWQSKIFEDGTWGGRIGPGFEPEHGEVVAQQHWCSSGFANIDLDHQLKAHELVGSISPPTT
jgi:nicotinamidase-related amidase